MPERIRSAFLLAVGSCLCVAAVSAQAQGTGPRPQDFEFGQMEAVQTIDGWTVHRGGGWCLAEAAAEGDPRERVYMALSDDGVFGLFGATWLDRPALLDVFSDTRISVAVDGETIATGKANGMIRTRAPLPGIIPVLVISEDFEVDGVVAVETLEQGLTAAGMRVLDQLRVDAEPDRFWGAVAAGRAIRVEATAGSEPLVEGTFSLTGSARTLRALRDCAG